MDGPSQDVLRHVWAPPPPPSPPVLRPIPIRFKPIFLDIKPLRRTLSGQSSAFQTPKAQAHEFSLTKVSTSPLFYPPISVIQKTKKASGSKLNQEPEIGQIVKNRDMPALMLIGKIGEPEFSRIRVWRDKQGATFYDCDCGRRKPRRLFFCLFGI